MKNDIKKEKRISKIYLRVKSITKNIKKSQLGSTFIVVIDIIKKKNGSLKFIIIAVIDKNYIFEN